MQNVPWNKGRLTGQKRPLKPKDVWAIRVRPLLPLVIADANEHGVRRSDRSVVRMLMLRTAVMTLR